MTKAQPTTHIHAKITACRLFGPIVADPWLWRWMKDYGIDLDQVANIAGPVIRVSGGFYTDFFELDPLGESCLVASVYDKDAESTIDLVGWSARNPDRFAAMYGNCGVLGIDQLLNPATYAGGAPCPIWTTPWNWLKASCRGAVILDHQEARNDLNRAPGVLAAESAEHAWHLVNAGILRPERIVVPAQERRAA